MARRNLFQNIKDADGQKVDRAATSGYAARGASRNILASIGELAEKAARADLVLEGEAIVEIDPTLIDQSFVQDRMEDEAAFRELVDAIEQRGQDSPVLVRPHPTTPNRYQTVFGFRRVRAARDLGRKVKAIVRAVSDNEHVIAQGQENSARENLSFIERALFAQRLLDSGYDRQTIQTALTIDASMLTRMLSVSSRVPEEVAVAIGPSRTVGRDRWLEFAQLVESPEARRAAVELIRLPELASLASDVRFERLHSELKSRARQRRGASAKSKTEKWQTPDMAVAADFTDTGRSLSVAFKSKNGRQFGRFVMENLDRLYDEFKQRNEQGEG
ncbi:plasmid partitioning protein RepB [Mesorhizobium sp. M2A.F.Ca.ET.042.01.1.1]|uniref:plasmid partitioning protein RepB n=1 Tax=Mesorhizobium sp. M2A.F.Ca.ET.042.01.1.1 TaxID=2496745 RepID=UPI000FCBF2A1|nr:plasmid partitioning protein RepB [Mesorhizobium sp. M2A.F.Ca.ET.042.01.1.1]RUX13020.1 plasmid partitioning protein RepB [Mesorhizobium sp. M2A.F.Ca.ET.042.01.1.1]